MTGYFSFETINKITNEEGIELEALLLHWALLHKNRIKAYWYDTKPFNLSDFEVKNQTKKVK